MERIFDTEFYEKLHTLRMSIALNLASGQSGGRKSNSKGNSVEFSDFREYMIGDDIRRIDWNAYARFDKLFVKLFMEEKEGVFQIFLDCSESMKFGEKSKEVCAKRIAGALSYIVLENGDRLYINALKDNHAVTAGSFSGMQSFIRTIKFLEEAPLGGPNDLYTSIKEKDFKTRGLSFIITDGYTENLDEVIKYLKYKKQDVVLIQVLSDEEMDPRYEGILNLKDSEFLSELRVSFNATAMKMYRESLKNFLDNMDSLCKKYGVTYIRVKSSDTLDSLFFSSLARLAKKV
ncbi:MAG: DUF58 domain-containing protein [Lachnospiraceae bacterium]|jgi:uncharacterized protein (DUF58 family)|nr:DUF58 domain-containing protein [Lachnospiraceae bacterium]MBP5276048.1 DUF58 domain-containing protein [Lachnospiraceae bacterium]MBP5564291.1 DUF58 domain-containing protein [Lachnospiraceae bacterium]MBQ4275436.1 DUF58 domain-containing protein [Lachnospiraceae bacterium]